MSEKFTVKDGMQAASALAGGFMMGLFALALVTTVIAFIAVMVGP